MKLLAGLLFLCAQISTAAFAAPPAADAFAFPQPEAVERGQKRVLYSTFYHVWPAQASDTGAAVTLDNGTVAPFKLSARDWCFAAMEGTAVVKLPDGTRNVINFADKGGGYQVNCRPYFSSVGQSVIDGMARSRFNRLGPDTPFGLGVGGYRLVPFRTVAVDASVVPYGTILFVPKLKGLSFTDQDGYARTHDGYVYAADKGGLIKGNHVDFFSGIATSNPFPTVIRSVPQGVFEAFVTAPSAVKAFLDSQHKL